MRHSPFRTLALLLALLAFAASLPGCGIAWWGAAAGAGWYFYDSSTEEDDEETGPVVLSLSSTAGEEVGGQSVTVNGERFESGCRVFFGSVESTSVTFISAFMIQVVTPPYSTGAAPASISVDVHVENPDGQKGTLAGAYTYQDNISPAQVSDLTATPGNTDEVILQFTAVGDNGTIGTAASYDLRWSANPIDEANWGSAQTDLAWTQAIGAAGSTETDTFTKTWATFYFALKVSDDAGNVSAISNSVQFDPYPPDAASGFSVAPGTQRGRVAMRWTTTADDGSLGSSGPVSAYVIRYARTPILDDAMFNNALDVIQVGAPWTPAAANGTETREVELPEFVDGDKFYFALKIEDDVRNISPLSACRAEMVYEHKWMLSQMNPALPGRRGSAVVYDSKRGRLLAITGWEDSGPTYFQDVYALNLRGNGMGFWTLLAPGGGVPNGRWGAAAVYDPLNDRVVFFGGYDNVWTTTNDLWTLEFSSGPAGAWNQISAHNPAPPVGSPSPRYGASAVYDPFAKRMLLIGGGSGVSTFSQVFALDLTPGSAPTWSILAPTSVSGPFPVRWGASAAFVPELNGVVVFGGHNGLNASRNDLWFLNLSIGPPDGQWRFIPTTLNSPAPRGEAAHAFDPYNNRLIVVGGHERVGAGNTIRPEAWACTVLGTNSAIWAQLPVTGVPGLWGTGGCFDLINQRMVYFGGVDWTSNHNGGALMLSLRSLEVEEGWTPRATGVAVPNLPRAEHGMAYDLRSKKMVVFGGWDGAYCPETYSADMSGGGAFSWQLEVIAGSPSARRGHVMVTDSVGRRVLMFGGRDQPTGLLQEVWELSDNGVGGFNWINRTPALTGSATAREYAAGVFIPEKNWFVVYGGVDGGGSSAELDILDLNTLAWTNAGQQLAAGQPGRLSEASAVYDPETGTMVLFGGFDGSIPAKEAWVLDIRGLSLSSPSPTWTQVKAGTTGPTARRGCTGVWDAPNHRALFFGGMDDNGLVTRELWALYINGHTAMKAPTPKASGIWEELSPFGTAPASRAWATMALDPPNLRVIGFGGTLTGGGQTQATFELRAPTPEIGAVMENIPTLPVSRPPAREGHTALLDRVNDRMIVFGGFGGGNNFFNTTFLLNNVSLPGNETWTPANITTPVQNWPPGRTGHGAFFWPYTPNTFMVITCGHGGSTTYYRDAWVLTDSGGGTCSWTQFTGETGTPPPNGLAYFGHGYDWPRGQLLLVCGESSAGLTNEVYSLKLGSPLDWTLITPISSTGQLPHPRKNPGVVMLDDTTLVMFGGEGVSGQLNDIWMLVNYGVWVWVRLPDTGVVPPARFGPAMFAPQGMKGGFTWGGNTGSAGLTDFWQYRSLGGDTGRFGQPGFSGAVPIGGLWNASTVWDETNQRAIIFGGRGQASVLQNDMQAIKLYQPVGR